MAASEKTLEPLAVDAKRLGELLTVSERSIWTRHAAGELPSPHQFGSRRLWDVAEIKAWIAAGMPERELWNRMKVQGR